MTPIFTRYADVVNGLSGGIFAHHDLNAARFEINHLLLQTSN